MRLGVPSVTYFTYFWEPVPEATLQGLQGVWQGIVGENSRGWVYRTTRTLV